MATNNFIFLIGAPKCGTTSLANWLERHSQVTLMPGKEPGFFREYHDNLILDANQPEKRRSVAETSPRRNFDAYMAPSLAAAKDQWILDASTDYLSDGSAAHRIAEFAKSRTVKLICVLRDPVERALSEYRHTVRDRLEPLSFQDSIAEEESRRRENYQPLFFHVRRSQYYDDIKRFQGLFPENLLLLGIDALSDMDCCAKKLFNFLELPSASLGDINQDNSTIGGPHQAEKPGHLRGFYRTIKKTIGFENGPTPKREATEGDRQLLKQRLRADIRKCVMDSSIPTDGWACIDAIQAAPNTSTTE